jgi:hypothetical protein
MKTFLILVLLAIPVMAEETVHIRKVYTETNDLYDDWGNQTGTYTNQGYSVERVVQLNNGMTGYVLLGHFLVRSNEVWHPEGNCDSSYDEETGEYIPTEPEPEFQDYYYSGENGTGNSNTFAGTVRKVTGMEEFSITTNSSSFQTPVEIRFQDEIPDKIAKK